MSTEKVLGACGMPNLMRIGDETCDALGRPGGGQHACPFLQAACSIRRGGQTLKALIQHPLYRALRDAEITRAEALVKAADTLLPRNLPYRRHAPAKERPWRGGAGRDSSSSNRSVRGRELQARLDDPDRIRRRARGDARYGGGAEVDVGVFLAVVELVGDDLLSVAIREEIYRPRGDDPHQSGHETLK
jgi:hypothetical protein